MPSTAVERYLRIYIMHKIWIALIKRPQLCMASSILSNIKGAQSIIESFHGTSLNRWTHHFLIQNTMECDEGLWNGWIRRIFFQRATDPPPLLLGLPFKILSYSMIVPDVWKILGECVKMS